MLLSISDASCCPPQMPAAVRPKCQLLSASDSSCVRSQMPVAVVLTCPLLSFSNASLQKFYAIENHVMKLPYNSASQLRVGFRTAACRPYRYNTIQKRIIE